MPSAVARLWVAYAPSGESSFAPLAGHLAWVDAQQPENTGIQLDLATREERLHWARIVTRARDELHARLVPHEPLTNEQPS